MNQSSKKKQVDPSLERIGDYKIRPTTFPGLDTLIHTLQESVTKKMTVRKRFALVNETLLKLIQEAPKESFLLSAVVDFIDRINQANILNSRYHITLFEFWLNLFSNISEEENHLVRGKIVGKFIPREEYQLFFPIGMDKTFNGTHFVIAHLSPDVDTMVASFWGWVDAFAARVGSARHVWSLPGGPPDSPVTEIFRELFSKEVFMNLSSRSSSLTLSAIDLVTQKGFVKTVSGSSSISNLDLGFGEKAIVLIDENNHFLGDWHNADVEPIRKIIIRFKSCLRWFENHLRGRLISLLAKQDLSRSDIPAFLASVFDLPISDYEPAKEFTARQQKDLHDFFEKVLGMPNGLKSTFRELHQALSQLGVHDLSTFQTELESLQYSDLFDSTGKVIEHRPTLFLRLEKIIHQLDEAIHHVRDYAEQLDIAMQIKKNVFGITPEFITLNSDVEEIRIKMQHKEYLPVVIPEEDGQLFPVGVVWASTLLNPTLGTASFRDFCNQEEVKMAPYLTPISVVDHHKSSLKTNAPPLALIGDTQSSNVIIAEQTLIINSHFSTNGASIEEIDLQLSTLRDAETTPTNIRLLQKLLQRRIAANHKGVHYVHPEREMAEYLCFLHAILDDTDLLTKVSNRDVLCVVELLNRLKSLISKSEVEVFDLDEIPRNKQFAKAAAKKLLKNVELYSVYKQVFESKEQEAERILNACQDDHFESLFVDTKEQNGCCRVGQTKLFTTNFPAFHKSLPQLMQYWLKNAQNTQQLHPKIDLHLHMVSTIASAEEVFTNKTNHYQHQDQLWFWIPDTQKSQEHLASFLTAFMDAQKQLGKESHLEFLKGVPNEVQQIFIRNCHGIKIEQSSNGITLPITVLYVHAGSLNSRKAMITPYLPRLF